MMEALTRKHQQLTFFSEGRFFGLQKKHLLPSLISGLISALVLSFVTLRVKRPMLLLPRFFPEAAFIEIIALSIYAVYICNRFLNSDNAAALRGKIWLFFSIVFFTQLLIGLLGIDQFLMTGKLHLPVPAMILSGPLYRGDIGFMPILLLSTVILIGPAWCSHLCYVGVWDNTMAFRKKKAKSMPKWRFMTRWIVFVSLIIVVVMLRVFGASIELATILGAAFGIAGAGIMILISSRMGVMAHCAVYCPIGIVTNVVGKVNPFRIRIKEGCNQCQACRMVCRMGALDREDILKKAPNINCTLCGDCIQSCKDNHIGYRFFKASPEKARIIFYVMIVTLHALFLGFARI